MPIRVLIADDQALMRSALRMCLDAEPDITIVAEAADGREAVRLSRQLHPDVVLIDIRMPHMDGVEATRLIVERRLRPPVRVVVITGFDVDEALIEALRAGASGFLVKDSSADEVVRAVRVVAGGDAMLSPSVTRRLLDGYARMLPRSTHAPAATTLTEREVTVLGLVARGMSNAQIAESLNVAVSSVKTHVGHLLAKLRLVDRVHLVIFAYENGYAGSASPAADER